MLLSKILLELYETRPLRDELRSRLMEIMAEWMDEYKHAMAKAAKSLRDSQTRNLKKHFGSFDTKNDAKLEKMYKTYRKKQEDAIFTWSFNRLADYINNAIEPPIRKLSQKEMPISIDYVGRNTSTRASMTGSRLAIHLKWEDWKDILEGNKSLDEVVNALVSDLVHEMVHYNQIVINNKHGNDIVDRGLATSRKNNRKFKKSIEQARKVGGNFELKDVAYFTSNHEIEAYAASIASEVVDKAKAMGITPRDFLKNHMMGFRDFRNFKFVSQEHPKVMKKLFRKIVQYVDHYTNDLQESVQS